MIRQVAALLTLLALATTAASAQDAPAETPAEQGITGAWQTSQGPMQVEQRGDNYVLIFAAIPGLVTGQLDDKGRLVGTWNRQDGPGPCSTEVDGSRHWGRFGLEFRPEGFAGAWTYCDGRPQGVNFTGSRAP
jgi:hypothetical protein